MILKESITPFFVIGDTEDKLPRFCWLCDKEWKEHKWLDDIERDHYLKTCQLLGLRESIICCYCMKFLGKRRIDGIQCCQTMCSTCAKRRTRRNDSEYYFSNAVNTNSTGTNTTQVGIRLD